MLAIEGTGFNLSGARRVPYVAQAESAECGLACLAMIAGWYGYDVDLISLRRRFSISLKGTTLRQLIDIAAQIGLAGRPVRCEPSVLASLRLPCIVHWDFNHFVVLSKVGRDRVWIHDPAHGIRQVPMHEFNESFTGVVLELVPADGFERKRDRQRLLMRNLWRWQPETLSALARAIVLSIFLESLMLLTPYYMQLVVDQAILKADTDLLAVLAAAFCLVSLFNAGASMLRSLVMQFLANVISYDMGARLMHHLLSLPLDFFQKRKLGDVLQRFRSLEPIKQFVVTGGISTVIDGLLAAITFGLMVLYSRRLAALVFVAVLVYSLFRFFFRTVARRFATQAMVTDAREQSQFLETIRAMQTIKATAAETLRETDWLNLYVAKINASIRVGNLGIGYIAVSSVLSGVSDIVIILIAAHQIIAGRLTVGILTAFLAYKGQFMSRVISLADTVIQYRMLDVQLGRVADLALAVPEQLDAALACLDSQLKGEFMLRDVVFRYSATEQPILHDITLHVSPGEFVVITGPSGAGKTTLLKILLGLYPYESGEVLVDSRPIAERGLSVIRRRVGVVMQEDQLLSGTVAENIALFDRKWDLERIRECARQAEIDDEIMALPMQYHTLVGDLGTSLSTGQRQRVLIARALYRRPDALILDEGTVHVGSDCERRLIEMIRRLKITRIVAAHSTPMMRAADRVLHLENGKLFDRVEGEVIALKPAATLAIYEEGVV